MGRKRRFFFPALAATAAVLIGFDYALWRLQANKKQRIEGLRTQVVLYERENRSLEERNQILGVEVETLRSPDSFYTYEEQAREAYGMIGRNETFFLLPETETAGIPDIAGLGKAERRSRQADPPPTESDDADAALQLESLP